MSSFRRKVSKKKILFVSSLILFVCLSIGYSLSDRLLQSNGNLQLDKARFSVTFDPNGGEVSLKNKWIYITKQYGDLPIPIRAGYTFEGWYTAIDGGDKIEKDTIVTKRKDLTIYAHWKANKRNVKLNLVAGKLEDTSIIVNDGIANIEVINGLTYPSLPVPQRSDYSFLGWYTDLEDGMKIEDNTIVSEDTDILYAHWDYKGDFISVKYPENIIKDLTIERANHHLMSFFPFLHNPTGENQESSEERHTREKENFTKNPNAPNMEENIYSAEVFQSRYFKTTINNIEVPIYMTPVIVPSLATVTAKTPNASCMPSTKATHNPCGYVYQNFSTILAKKKNLDIQVTIDSSIVIEKAELKNNYNGTGTLEKCENNVCTIKVMKTGIYTLVLNDDQRYAYTIFIEDFVDEELDIEKYKKSGYQIISYVASDTPYETELNITSDNTVVYVKNGAYLSVKKDTTYDGTGFINANNKNNIEIVGHGLIDMSRAKWENKKAIRIENSTNVNISGITMINSPNWTLYVIGSENVTIKNAKSFGYRSASDGFAIGNSSNVNLSYLYARTGDDLYTIRNMTDNKKTEDVTVDNCVAWGKERMFGIVGTQNAPINNVRFTNDVVIYNDCVLGDDKCGSLAIIVERGETTISNVTFENIRITKDSKRAILVNVETNTTIGDMYFNNIRYNASLNILFQNVNNYKMGINLKSIYRGSLLLTETNSASYITGKNLITKIE